MMKHDKFKKNVLSAFLCVSLLFFVAPHAEAEDVRSIVGDWFNKVFDVQLTNGAMVFDDAESKQERVELNNRIFDGVETGQHSLYDRFGGNIKFVPYFGETKIETGIFDRFYTKIMNNDGEFQITLEDLKMFMEKSFVSNNVIYDGRADILDREKINSGYLDPRAYAYSAVSTTGGDAALGNSALGFSKFVVALTGYICSSGLLKSMNNIIQWVVEHGLGDIVESLGYFALRILVAISLLVLVSAAFKMLKGHYTAKDMLSYLLSGAVSLGLMVSLIANPMMITDSLVSVATLFDGMMDESISETSDEVVRSDSSNNVRTAVLWRTAVFEPWCEGMFGDKYENLYTAHAELEQGQSAMLQDNDDVITVWDDESVKWNSVQMTGDVSVPLGGGKQVKNWAALAWSCQSLYHIDAVPSEYERAVPNSWPKAEVTPNNTELYVDNFRWLDAKLNISPEYRAVDKVRMNYSHSNQYTQSFVRAGNKSVLLSLMLIPLLALSVKKAVVELKIIGVGFSLMWKSGASLIMPGKYDILKNMRDVLNLILDHLWWSIAVFVSIILYRNMVGLNAVANLVYVILCVYMAVLKPQRLGVYGRRAVNSMKRSGKKMLQSARNLVHKN